ncbi:hypothetical protein DXM29_24555 [Agrobacterium tumefaciens]|uniref:hypothetical protein n=1 Tax=Agrobacterium tumefaciens TaxID=358 RepID=UPI00122FE760|nr:hypothetical protein DXM29_24555 [Agrobacterium tumefaciens]
MKTLVGGFHSGDVILASVDNVTAPTILRSASIKTVTVARDTAALFIGGSALLLVAVIWILMQANPLKLVLGADNRYSKSQLQLAS